MRQGYWIQKLEASVTGVTGDNRHHCVTEVTPNVRQIGFEEILSAEIKLSSAQILEDYLVVLHNVLEKG